MHTEHATEFVRELYLKLLDREPRAGEDLQLTEQSNEDCNFFTVFNRIVNSREYKVKRGVSSIFSPGHFHSPVVDPATVGDYHRKSQATMPSEIMCIDMNVERMIETWHSLLPVMKSTAFPDKPATEYRFHYQGGPFPWGDAITLRAIIQYFSPRKVIEIGSGFTTACMLDTADEFAMDAIQITCIEPYPKRLFSLLRSGDFQRIEVLEKPVQEVSIERFDSLGENDILFIDSTHVLKTGSDVHYELFYILPRLRPGVLVHFHDCQFPFEYPRKWVFEQNFSWNEAYALRAFLMYNKKFEVLFWGSMLARVQPALLTETCPDFMKNAGGSLWLRTR